MQPGWFLQASAKKSLSADSGADAELSSGVRCIQESARDGGCGTTLPRGTGLIMRDPEK